MINTLNFIGYFDERFIVWANATILNYNDDLQYYQEFYDELYKVEVWTIRMNEYPIATTVWLYLKEQGYNDYVAAGIIGNMMTECGGQTLALNPNASSGSYYGICQWGSGFSNRYTDLDGQLQLLMDTIENEFNWYGNMNYESFLSLTNERDAALAFAKSYERCTSASYTQRQNNAERALAYFANN